MNMIVKYLTFFFILLTFVVIADCDTQGVCTTTYMTVVREWERGTKRKIETYYTFTGRCFPRGCMKTRWRVVTETRLVPKTKMATIQSCCSGYIDVDHNVNNIKCQPICIPECKNGYCRAPGECECTTGFVIDPHDNRNCLPSCPAGTCEHGACIAPLTCQCNYGYTMNNGTCQPICTDPCRNGSCVAPETCECNFGYRKSNDNICEPYCSIGCENGTCVGPETCRCNPGFHKVDSDTIYTNQSCAPFCTDPCDNGVCVAPDTCQCLPGYEKSDKNTCQPRCSEGCGNGTCVAPETCRCNTGWSAKTLNECEPVCINPCGNGTCVAPETCDCFSGYEWNSTCVPQCTDGCAGGVCVSPNVCQCETGWECLNGTCVPECKYSCGNGTCISPNVCSCFNGYHLDIEKLVNGHMTGGLCIPTCTNCSGTCVAPNLCMIAVTTEKVLPEGSYGDYDFGNGSTIDDGLLAYGSTLTSNDTDVTVIIIKTSDKPDKLKTFWLKHHWTIITFPVLLIVLICMAAVVAWRWRYLSHYIKGESYTVQGNIADAQRTSSFDNVSYSTLEKRE